MLLTLGLATSIALSCSAPPWRANQVQAMQDSADVIVEGFVIGVRMLRPPEVTEEEYLWTPYEATILVERSWLQPLDSVVTVRVENIECDPNPWFLADEVLGLKARDYGWWAFATLDDGYLPIDTAEVSAYFAELGPGQPPSRSGGGSRWLLWLAAAFALVAGGLAWSRRRPVMEAGSGTS